MATARDIIQTAYVSLDVYPSPTTVNGGDEDYALVVFNRMLHGWKTRGVDVGHADYTLNSVIALDDSTHDALALMLASRLAPRFQAQNSVDAMATDEAWRRIYAFYAEIDEADMPSALQDMPSRPTGMF